MCTMNLVVATLPPRRMSRWSQVLKGLVEWQRRSHSHHELMSSATLACKISMCPKSLKCGATRRIMKLASRFGWPDRACHGTALDLASPASLPAPSEMLVLVPNMRGPEN